MTMIHGILSFYFIESSYSIIVSYDTRQLAVFDHGAGKQDALNERQGEKHQERTSKWFGYWFWNRMESQIIFEFDFPSIIYIYNIVDYSSI